jgi:hypothetical protein
MGFCYASAANLKKLCPRMSRNQWFDVELDRTVKAETAFRNVLSQHAINPDAFRWTIFASPSPVDHDEVIANTVEGANVATREALNRTRDRAALLKEDAVTQLLGATDFVLARRQTRFERAGAD